MSDQSEEVVQPGSELESFAFRLRFRTTKGITHDEKALTFEVDGVEVTLTHTEDKTLRDGGWLALKATGFPSLAEAESFGKRLRTALQVTSIRRFLGVDVGEDKPTSAFGKTIVDKLAEEGYYIRSNVHGLDVYEDKLGTAWSAFGGKGSVSTDPKAFIDDLIVQAGKVGDVEPPLFDAVRLLNEALISGEAAAQLVLAIAAVEMLAQGEKWSETQSVALQRLKAAAEQDEALNPTERAEVADAIERTYRISVRQGIKRLIEKLSLNALWKPWEEIYSKRSALLHGLTYASSADRGEMVFPALALSSRIVLKALEQHVEGVAEGIEDMLPLPTE